MDLPFHQYLLDQIKQKFKSDVLIAQEIMGIINQSKSNVYKKISGTVPFSLEEALILSRHFGISIDNHIFIGSNKYEKLSFDYSLLESVDANNPASYLEKIRISLEHLTLLDKPKLVYATTGLPLFHFLEYRNLLAFKLFVWCRINWQIEGMENSIFDSDTFYEQWPTIEADRKAIMELYTSIDSKEFWPSSLVNNVLNQVKYYNNSNFFLNSEMPLIIQQELVEMLESRFSMAASGCKRLPETEARSGAFELFLNEMVYTNNLILVYTQHKPVAVYATMDDPNFVRSTDEDFCTRMDKWIQRIELSSFDTRNEYHRHRLFRTLRKQVDSF